MILELPFLRQSPLYQSEPVRVHLTGLLWLTAAQGIVPGWICENKSDLVHEIFRLRHTLENEAILRSEDIHITPIAHALSCYGAKK